MSNFSFARASLQSDIQSNNVQNIKDSLRAFENACIEEELNFSSEICSLMHRRQSQACLEAWNYIFRNAEIDTDDFHVQSLSLPANGMFWLVEAGLNAGVPLDFSNPNVLASFCSGAPLEAVNEAIDLQRLPLHPHLLAVATINTDQRVFSRLLEEFPIEVVQHTLTTCADNWNTVNFDSNHDYSHLNPHADFVQAAIERKILQKVVGTPTHSKARRL